MDSACCGRNQVVVFREHGEGSLDSIKLTISFSSRILLNSTDKNGKHQKARNNIIDN